MGDAAVPTWDPDQVEALRRERESFQYDEAVATTDGSRVANYLLRELMVALGKPLVARGESPQQVWGECIEDVRWSVPRVRVQELLDAARALLDADEHLDLANYDDVYSRLAALVGDLTENTES